MKISILTLFPNMITSFFQESIVKRAQEKKAAEIEVVDIIKDLPDVQPFDVEKYSTEKTDELFLTALGFEHAQKSIFFSIMQLKKQE